jgi:MerR family transcriptional regulator/heat shock protein HspR
MGYVETKPLFTLSVAAEILGVHPRTLMIYESEGLVVPARTKTNRRRYSQKDIRKLQFIRFLTNKRGVNLTGVKIILEMIQEAEKRNFDFQKTVFPEFMEKQLL